MPHLQLCVRIPMLTFPGFCHGPTFWEHEAQWCSTLLPVVWVSPVGWGRCEEVNIGQEAWGEGGKREPRVMEMGILGSGWWKTYGCFTQHFLALLNSNVLKFLKLTIYDNLLNLISKLLNIHNEDFLGHTLESSFLFPTLGDHFLRQGVAPCWGFRTSSWWPWVLSEGVSAIGAGSSYSNPKGEESQRFPASALWNPRCRLLSCATAQRAQLVVLWLVWFPQKEESCQMFVICAEVCNQGNHTQKQVQGWIIKMISPADEMETRSGVEEADEGA